MRKGSGAAINLIFFALALLLAGALAGIGVYIFVHEPDKEKAEPVMTETVTEASEPTEEETVPTETTTEATTSKATTSATTTKASSAPDRLEYHAYIDTITEKAPDVEYEMTDKDSGDVFHIYSGDKLVLSSFKDSSSASIAKDKDASTFDKYINSPNVRADKSDIGLTAEIREGKKLRVESLGGECDELVITSNNDKYADIEYKADTKKGTLEADLSDGSFRNGLYVIHGEFTEGGKKFPINLYLYVNCKSDDEKDMHFYLCSLSRVKSEPATTSEQEATSEPATSSTAATTSA